jgi:hypothetical protein
MNLVGKIFTVLIFVMSIFFSACAVAVYSTHKNWREVVMNPKDQATRDRPVGLHWQLEDLRKRKQDLEDEKANVEEDLERERKAAIQVRSKLETENERLERDVEDKQNEINRLDKTARESATALQTSHEELARLRGEVDQLRADILQAQNDRDKYFKDVVQLTDDLHQVVNELKRLKDLQTRLAADKAQAERVLRHFNLDKDMSLDPYPPPVEGLVTAAPQPDLVEISIGSDDGLRKGHKLYVYRVAGGTSKLVGRIEVVRADFDKSVCKIDPEWRQSYVQRGDRVISKILQ